MFHGAKVDEETRVLLLLRRLGAASPVRAAAELDTAHFDKLEGEHSEHDRVQDEAKVGDGQDGADVFVAGPIGVVCHEVDHFYQASDRPAENAQSVIEDGTSVEHESLWQAFDQVIEPIKSDEHDSCDG